MCTTCGCGSGQTLIGGRVHTQHTAGATLRYRAQEIKTNNIEQKQIVENLSLPAATADTSPSRLIKIERDILAKNNSYAADNRNYFSAHGIFALNLVSSPGSGKTSLLVKTIAALKGTQTIAVIEGDQQTDNDAARIRAAGAPAVQINTGKGCHLDAAMVEQAMQQLTPQDDSLLLIENVGNLVCPSGFDLGEAHKVVILSVTEGEDKPLKYPDMFRAADLMLLNKCDLLPYLEFDVDLAIAYALRVNPKLEVIRISASSGEGMAEWLTWIKQGCAHAAAATQQVTAVAAVLE
jgi:hydrogenase nickel incorporation protein HypB